MNGNPVVEPGKYDYCQFNYPIANQVSFFPGQPPVAETDDSCPGSMFLTTIDIHGAARIAYKTPGQTFTLTKPVICIVQIFAPKQS